MFFFCYARYSMIRKEYIELVTCSRLQPFALYDYGYKKYFFIMEWSQRSSIYKMSETALKYYLYKFLWPNLKMLPKSRILFNQIINFYHLPCINKFGQTVINSFYYSRYKLNLNSKVMGVGLNFKLNFPRYGLAIFYNYSVSRFISNMV